MESAPDFAEVETDYPTLLTQTGWTLTGRSDVTEGYASTMYRQIGADSAFKDDLEGLIGMAEFAERLASWRCEFGAIEEGLLRRDLFVATPTLA